MSASSAPCLGSPERRRVPAAPRTRCSRFSPPHRVLWLRLLGAGSQLPMRLHDRPRGCGRCIRDLAASASALARPPAGPRWKQRTRWPFPTRQWRWRPFADTSQPGSPTGPGIEGRARPRRLAARSGQASRRRRVRGRHCPASLSRRSTESPLAATGGQSSVDLEQRDHPEPGDRLVICLFYTKIRNLDRPWLIGRTPGT